MDGFLDKQLALQKLNVDLSRIRFFRLAEEDSSLTDFKSVARSLFPRCAAVDGLGLGVCETDPENREINGINAEQLQNLSQTGMSWKNRLKIAAAISSLTIDSDPKSSPSNDERVNYIKSIAKPGDILFVTGGGKGQSFLSELYDLASRVISFKSYRDLSFPFTHVMVNLGDGSLIDLCGEGIRRQTWEQAFIQNPYYDCIALGSIEGADSDRSAFVDEVRKTATRLTVFNKAWMFLKAPFEIRGNLADTSVEGQKGVCVDLVTESAQALVTSNPKLSPLANGITPFHIFKSDGLKIKAAINLDRQ